MNELQKDQGTILGFDDTISTWVEAFMIDRESQNISPNTKIFYRNKLRYFVQFCSSQGVDGLMTLRADLLRRYMLWLTERGHNPGGIHACYRVIKTFLFWYEREVEPENWKNPIRKIKAPKVPLEILEPVSKETIIALLQTCNSGQNAKRDKTLILFLADTGARASEVCSINLEDVNPITGKIIIRKGKGQKARTVFIGGQTRKALRSYLMQRKPTCEALFISATGERLGYWGVEAMLERRAKKANIPAPSCHSFRRYYCLESLRHGASIYYLRETMGHADLQVLQRYLKITEQDIENAHREYGPIDRLFRPK